MSRLNRTKGGFWVAEENNYLFISTIAFITRIQEPWDFANLIVRPNCVAQRVGSSYHVLKDKFYEFLLTSFLQSEVGNLNFI